MFQKVLHQVRKLNQICNPAILSEKFLSLSLARQDFDKPLIKCPSIKSFQLPINDFKITDILKRHELTLPEINKKKEILVPASEGGVDKTSTQITF